MPLALLLPRLPPAVRSDEARLSRVADRDGPRSASSVPGRWAPGSPRSRSRPVTRVLLHDVDRRGDRARPRPDPDRPRTPCRAARPRRRLHRRLGRRTPGIADATATVARGRRRGLRPRDRSRSRGPRGASGRSSGRSTMSATDATLLATNTSALSVAAIASATTRPGPSARAAFLQPGAADAARRGRLRAGHDPTPRSIRPSRSVDGVGQDAGPLRRHAWLHRQPGQPAVHARGARDARGRRRDDRRRSMRRSAPPASRWDRSSSWTSSASTSISPPPAASTTGRSRPATRWPTLPAVADPGTAGRGRASRPKGRSRVLPLRERRAAVGAGPGSSTLAG